MLEGETLEEVKDFRYLGSIVDTHGGAEADVKKRISKASVSFHLLRNVWKSKVIGETTKIRLFNTNVKSVLLYGAETWRINKSTLIRIQTFVNHCLRRILRIHWMDRVSSIYIWDRTHRAQIEIEILKRRWGWLGLPKTGGAGEMLWMAYARGVKGLKKKIKKEGLNCFKAVWNVGFKW